jgi:hypothetical protein
MKRAIAYASTFVTLVTLLAIFTTANAAGNPTAPGQNKILCFDGTTETAGFFGGVCTLLNNGAKGPATLDNTDSNPNGDYSGVYTKNSTLSGQLLGDVKQLSYSYTGNIAPTPTDLSLNVPLDETGSGATTEYAFIDAFYCPGVAGNVDVINDPTCGIFVGGVVFYPNWAALVAANPTWKVATDNLTFVIAERVPGSPPAFWTISHLTLGKPGSSK